ncbi:hypothetical protein [Pontivivens insulae]|uniref:Uncharacterized protein n=1 Tax=Pontivivens insulae TaxID=1639689 RepID=A0A2R8ACA3_9RHOB|nr:hypothetical protein [Pontivivens insulae]RED13773.1 hypothetical protein DFR53_1115 [Pontivivens insulae]SPF29847.1 hypothetical protein POI8812_02168 [Pontivivens insulae]
MSGEANGLAGTSGYVEWLGLDQEPTLMREFLLLLLSPGGGVGIMLGAILIAFLKWRSLRRMEMARSDLVSQVAQGRHGS